MAVAAKVCSKSKNQTQLSKAKASSSICTTAVAAVGRPHHQGSFLNPLTCFFYCVLHSVDNRVTNGLLPQNALKGKIDP